jgi:hypothetical protein
MARAAHIFASLDVHYFEDDRVLAAGDAWPLHFAAILACKRLLTDGELTRQQLARIAPESLPDVARAIDRLVEVGLFIDKGTAIVVHGWAGWNDSSGNIEAMAISGEMGNHLRWHKKRGVTKPGCSFCDHRLDSPPNRVPDPDPIAPPTSPDSQTRLPRLDVDIDVDTETDGPDHPPSETDELKAQADTWCQILAIGIVTNGSDRPAVTLEWQTAAANLVALDKRVPEDVEALLRWCQADTFWSGIVGTMPKFRQHFDTMRRQWLAEKRDQAPRQSNVPEPVLARIVPQGDIWEEPQIIDGRLVVARKAKSQ